EALGGFLEAAGYGVIGVRNRDVSRKHLEEVLRERLGPDRQFPRSRRERGSGGEDRNAASLSTGAHTIDMYRCRAYVRMWRAHHASVVPEAPPNPRRTGGRRVCELDASDGRARERCRDARRSCRVTM